MKTITSTLSALIMIATQLHAAPPVASADYGISASSIDSGGSTSSSSIYSNDGAVGVLVGMSSAANPSVAAKHGYVGQLYDITGHQITANPAAVPEGEETQLTVHAVADDESLVALEEGTIAWDVIDGPLVSITNTGLATADVVPQDTIATVEASFGNLTETLDLTVLDTVPDNFGLYAADGLPDDWQVGHFGEENPLAAPDVDVTGNGQTNLFSYIADLDPNNHSDVFRVRIEPNAVENRMNIIFSPRKETRNYRVLENGGLGPIGWLPVEAPTVEDADDERTVTDPAAVEDRKFYRIEITVPE